ncbi:ABC transporter permease [Sphaerimonospora mesophila]|uniref:ABC transporter permease n=1 Tax=Sphaerimonospora mesophila TaxID=37483 RepID=UPI0006E36A63
MTSTALLLSGRTMKRFLRTPPLIIIAFVFPVVLMFTILPLYGGLIGDDYIQRLAPLIVLSTATFGMAPSAAGLYADFRAGIFNRLRTMPISAASTVAGRIVGEVLRIVAVAVVAIAVAHIPGFRFTAGPAGVLGFFCVVAVFGAMCTSVSLLVALTGPDEDTVQSALGTPATLAFFLSSGFIPVTAFPGWIQPVVRVNPLSTASEALIGLTGGGPVAAPLLQTLAWAVGLGGLCALLSVRAYRRRAR